ncbi:aspartate--tRNA ligase 2, cytoplasmic isoform X1 [Citrus sinensis]|uniref:aspartate--tRNA ligase 2, cytoplasmic isoform X1 n=1 Tax=Citrus sinensis TaxID=2711 RepID=UPI002279CE4E|nr:aspartate--tRNA ligase 2, cytoplasmic isoform X1 [Citrus sinensis]
MDSLKNQEVLTRGHVQRTRPVGNKLAFVVVRGRGSIVQCLTTVEVQIKRLFCVSKIKKTPITIEDPFSSEVGIKKALKVQEGVRLSRVNQDT